MKYLLSVNIIFTDITETEKRSASCPQETFLLFFRECFSLIFFFFNKKKYHISSLFFLKKFSHENESAAYLSSETQSSRGRILLNFFRASLTCPNFEIIPCLQSFLHKLWVILKSKFKTQFSPVASFIIYNNISRVAPHCRLNEAAEKNSTLIKTTFSCSLGSKKINPKKLL